MASISFCLLSPIEIYQKIALLFIFGMNFGDYDLIEMYDKIVQLPIYISIILLIMALGFVVVFFGYQLTHFIIGLCGFLVMFSSSFLLLGGYWVHAFPIVILISILMGLIGSAFAIFFYKTGVFLLGVLGGFSLGMMVLPIVNNPLILLALGIIGGCLSFLVEKAVLIISTASIGSLVVVWGLVRILEYLQILSISSHFEPSYFRWVCLLSWLGLGILGCAVQYKYDTKKRKRKQK